MHSFVKEGGLYVAVLLGYRKGTKTLFIICGLKRILIAVKKYMANKETPPGPGRLRWRSLEQGK